MTITAHMTIGRKMGLGFGVLLALVATLAVVVLFNLDNMHRQFSFVIQHDAPVIANARHLLTLVVDMETGQRGFVITGKDEFLEPYENAVAAFSGLLSKEKMLVSDNPAQVKLLEGIEASVQEWQDKAAAPEIAMRRKIGEATVDAQQLQEILSQGEGKRIIDRFMALGHEVEVFFSEQGDWEGAFAMEIIEKCLTDREDGQRGFLITGKEGFLEKYTAGEQKDLPAYFAKLRTIVSDRGFENELKGKIDQLEQLAADWTYKAAEPEIAARRQMNKHPETLKDVAVLLEAGTGKRILDRIREDFKKFIAEEERLTAMRFTSASQASRRTTNTTILLALISLIFGGFMAMKITRGITEPVGKLTGALEMVAKGDLGQEIEIKSNDEIGELSTSFNRMVGDLKLLEGDRQRAVEELKLAHEELEDKVQERTKELEATNETLRLAQFSVDGASDSIFWIGSDSHIRNVNQAVCKTLGYSRQELMSMTIHDIDPNFSREDWGRAWEALRVSGDVVFETTHRKRDGGMISVEVVANYVIFGDVEYNVAFARDITARKLAEEALREREELYRNAIAAADAVVYQKEFAGNTYSYMGAAITDLIGYDVDEVTPELWLKIVTQVEMHGSARDKSQSELRRLFINGELPVWKGDYKCITKNGETRWLNDSSVPIHDEAGKVVGCLGVLQNITDRKLAEERLHLSEDRLTLALEATSEGVWDWNIATGEIFCSPSWCNALGFDPSEVEPHIRFWNRLTHPEDMPRVTKALNAHFQQKTELFECEVRLRMKSGEYRWILDRGKVVERDEDGKPLRMVGVDVDITERKQAEESRAMLSRELDHRVKNNLTSVITLAQLTAQSTDSIKDFVRLFTDRITSLARVHEMLAYRQWKGIELEELMRVAIGPFHAYEQRLRLSGPEIIVSARNVQPLALVMHELLSNAARHGSLSSEDGIVEVKWQRHAQRVVIDWSEQGGPPIANPQEFGVGLRLVSGFVEKEIGGKLEVDFNAKGFKCVIQLPAP